jgi:hypothetical protein
MNSTPRKLATTKTAGIVAKTRSRRRTEEAVRRILLRSVTECYRGHNDAVAARLGDSAAAPAAITDTAARYRAFNDRIEAAQRAQS